jgi:DNA-binding HxlR family transcriptional regulator
MEDVQFRTSTPPGGVDATSEPCPLRTALNAIGGRWKPVVLYHLLQRPHGFGELSRTLDGVSNKTLTTQLRELERDGLVSREVCDDARRSVRYTPTDAGVALRPVIRALIDWGNWRIATSPANAHDCGVE